MVDVAPFIVSHDKFNLHYGKNINLVQLELARFVVPFRGVRNRVKTKNRKANIRPCGTQHVLPLAYYEGNMPYLELFVKFYFRLQNEAGTFWSISNAPSREGSRL